MKFSWGHKIAFAYLAFVAGIMFLVYKASQQKFDLVTEDYYGEELKYQNVIDQKGRVAQLSAAPVITHSVNEVNIQLPGEFNGKEVKGELYLYRPSDATKDLRKAFTINGNYFKLELPQSLSGIYDVKLSWQAEGQSFYNEQKIFF